ncbi:hypothetical protein JVU11DRAFT_6684 [Chiua virens]|nr:hypothetical protein JVU11DRAFT_6684 [Chiua virens]
MTLRTKRSDSGMATEARPLCLHVYRIGGIWSDDKIIQEDDRKTPRYFLKGTRPANCWQFALHLGRPNGVPICHVKSPYLGPPMVATDPGPITITITGPERRTINMHRRSPDVKERYSFRGLDEEAYRWKQRSQLLGNIFECLNSQDQVVATYRITTFAISKDGELRIYQV